MRQLILIAITVVVTTFAFANTQNSSFNNNSTQLKAQLKTLGSAFKTQPIIVPKENSHDITMGYAGQDVSRKPTIAPHTTTI